MDFLYSTLWAASGQHCVRILTNEVHYCIMKLYLQFYLLHMQIKTSTLEDFTWYFSLLRNMCLIRCEIWRLMHLCANKLNETLALYSICPPQTAPTIVYTSQLLLHAILLGNVFCVKWQLFFAYTLRAILIVNTPFGVTIEAFWTEATSLQLSTINLWSTVCDKPTQCHMWGWLVWKTINHQTNRRSMQYW